MGQGQHTFTFVGLAADGKVNAVSCAYEDDTWPDHRHRSFCKSGSVIVRKMKPDAARDLIDTVGFVDGFMQVSAQSHAENRRRMGQPPPGSSPGQAPQEARTDPADAGEDSKQ